MANMVTTNSDILLAQIYIWAAFYMSVLILGKISALLLW
jgi:hypothetical protein